LGDGITTNRQIVAATSSMLYDEGKTEGFGQNNDCALHILIRVVLNCASGWVVENHRGTFCHVSGGD
ncbi:MAG: hypothetical protein ACXVBU_03560, partial [Ktedonobacteraceae bacterium]